MKQSEQINELAAALAAAQGEFAAIEKNRTGKVQTAKASYQYDYADLADVVAAVRPALSRHGLAYSHDVVASPDGEGVAVTVTCRLDHASGQWRESSPLLIPCEGYMGAAQLIGSASTYGRRYTLCAILGVVAESDDDGNGASGHSAETKQKAPPPPCPKCGTAKAVIRGKEEFGGGWLCFTKKGGCGEKWQDAQQGQTNQQAQQPKQESRPQDRSAGQNEYMAKVVEYGKRFADCCDRGDFDLIRSDLAKEAENVRKAPEIATAGAGAKLRVLKSAPSDAATYLTEFKRAVALADQAAMDALAVWMGSEATSQLFPESQWSEMKAAFDARVAALNSQDGDEEIPF